ncbi:MAG: hypothetical protein JXQ29_18585, partial [Planctomycetes bacterium]|nr:hypothetical protein [Planctomycetota bacterium]
LPPTGPAPAHDYVHIRHIAPVIVDPAMLVVPSIEQIDLGPLQDAPALSRSFASIPDTGSFPADPVIAAGNSYVVACVNRHVAFFTKGGKLLFQSHFANFFSPLGTAGINLFDPWCLWDPSARRFLVMCVGRDDTNQKSYNYLAISRTVSPLNGWYFYRNDMSLNGNTPTSNWNDYPRMAVDQNCIYFTSNQLAFGGGFQYAKIRILQNKATLLAGGAGQLWWDFWNIKMPGTTTNAFSIRPCMTHDAASASSPYYLVNSFNSGGSHINFYAIENTTSRDPGPVFSSLAVPVATYEAPYNAIQQGGGETVELFGDAQLFNAVKRNSSIWCAHPIRRGASSTGGASLRWYEFKPNTWPTAGSPTKQQEGTFGLDSQWYFYPAVEVNANSEVAIVFNQSSADDYVGIRWTGRRPTDPPNTLQGSALLKAGEAYYVRKASNRNRWGDYNGASVAPDGSIWFMSMYARSTPPNTWGTWIGRVYEPKDEDVTYWVSSFGGTQGSHLLGFAGSSLRTSVALPAATSPDAVCMDPFNYRVLVFDTDKVYRYYVNDGQSLLPGSVFSSALVTGGDQIHWGGVDEGGGIFWTTGNGNLYRSASITGANPILVRSLNGANLNAAAYNPATGGWVLCEFGGTTQFVSRSGAITRTIAGPGGISGIDHDPFTGDFILSRFGPGQGLVRLTQTGTLASFGPAGSPLLETANSVECREQPGAGYYGTEYGADPQHLWFSTAGGTVISLHATSGLFGPSDLELHRKRTLWPTAPFAVGATGTLHLDFGPSFAGDAYQVATSVGYLPGYSLPPAAGRVHLAPGDFLTLASVNGLDGGTIWKNFSGFLDVNGIATAQVAAPSIPTLQGLVLYYAAVVYNNVEGIRAISNTCSATFH